MLAFHGMKVEVLAAGSGSDGLVVANEVNFQNGSNLSGKTISFIVHNVTATNGADTSQNRKVKILLIEGNSVVPGSTNITELYDWWDPGDTNSVNVSY